MLQTQGRVRPGASCSVPVHQRWVMVAGPVLPDKMISSPCQSAQVVPAATLRCQNAGSLNPPVDGQGQHCPMPAPAVWWGSLRAFLRAILSPGRTNHVKNSNSLKTVRSLHQKSQVCSDGHLESAGGSWHSPRAPFGRVVTPKPLLALFGCHGLELSTLLQELNR